MLKIIKINWKFEVLQESQCRRFLMQKFRFSACVLFTTTTICTIITVFSVSSCLLSRAQRNRQYFDRQMSKLELTGPNESTSTLENPVNATSEASVRTVPSSSASPSPVKRRSLFIFGYDRSGTTFISKMFAQDPEVFIVYEPLWITKIMRFFEPGEHLETCELDVVSAILTCGFAKSAAARQFLTHTDRAWTGALPVNVFKSRHFCNSSNVQWERACHPPPPELADKVCSTKYEHSVVKVSPLRVPGEKLSVFVPQILVDNLEHDIKIVHIVRDPRGSIHSRIKLKWMHQFPNPLLRVEARHTCRIILANLKHAERMKTWLGDRYTVLRYKDIADTPIQTARRLYKFAGFDMPDHLISWVKWMTQPNENRILKNLDKPYSPVRNSTGNAEKWRQESPIGQVRMIEENCGALLDFLGLKRITNATQHDLHGRRESSNGSKSKVQEVEKRKEDIQHGTSVLRGGPNQRIATQFHQ